MDALRNLLGVIVGIATVAFSYKRYQATSGGVAQTAVPAVGGSIISLFLLRPDIVTEVIPQKMGEGFDELVNSL